MGKQNDIYEHGIKVDLAPEGVEAYCDECECLIHPEDPGFTCSYRLCPAKPFSDEEDEIKELDFNDDGG